MINFLELLKNIMLSCALYCAAELNIAEELESGPKNIVELAIKVDAQPETLTRLMNFLIINGIFHKVDNGFYQNNDLSSLISSNHPQSIKPLVMHNDKTRWNCFGNLTYSIKTGKDAFSEIYKEKYFDHLKKNPSLSKTFDQAMSIISSNEDLLISDKLSFSGIIADIGGGTGQLLDKIKSKHEAVTKTILFDLAEVVAKVSNNNHQVVAGSFFDNFKIKADTFILKRVLHDWNDEFSSTIIKNIANNMENGSKLIIIEGLLDRALDKTSLAAVDLALLTIFGGKERTLADFEKITANAGLKIISITEISELLFAVECIKI